MTYAPPGILASYLLRCVDVRISDSPLRRSLERGGGLPFVLPKPGELRYGTAPCAPVSWGIFRRGEVPAPLARRFSAGFFCHLERSIRTDEP